MGAPRGGAASPKLDIRVLGVRRPPVAVTWGGLSPLRVSALWLCGRREPCGCTPTVCALPLRRSPCGAGRWDRAQGRHGRRCKIRQTLCSRVPLR